MRTSERLTGLKDWTYKNLCQGRSMKAPGPNMDVTKTTRKEPRVYLAWAPTRFDKTGRLQDDAVSVVPGIIIMPNSSYAKNMEEQRFDRYNNISRPKQLGQRLAVSILFSIYEPGVMLPGFVESADENGKGLDMSLIQEGTETGLFTLLNWMDDFKEKLLGEKFIPHTDLFLSESTMTYGLYTDQEYVVDRRPVYYGFINATFDCYATEKPSSEIVNLLN